MLCRLKDRFEYVVVGKDNSNYVLDRIGFGDKKCKETYQKDKRYGIVTDNKILYGFENSMNGHIDFGSYVVFDCYFNDSIGYEVYKEKDFMNKFEIIGW